MNTNSYVYNNLKIKLDKVSVNRWVEFFVTKLSIPNTDLVRFISKYIQRKYISTGYVTVSEIENIVNQHFK